MRGIKKGDRKEGASEMKAKEHVEADGRAAVLADVDQVFLLSCDG